MTVERLDFSKPPPGYELVQLDDGMWWWGETAEWLDGTSYLDRHRTLAAAWAHHKARHDPPGMVVCESVCDGGDWQVVIDDVTVLFGLGGRAAAWLVYEDAVEVADLLEDGLLDDGPPHPTWFERCAWPRPLTWTTEQRAEVRLWSSWTSRPPFLPEVLRG